MPPKITVTTSRPGLAFLAEHRAEIQAIEDSSSKMKGRTEGLFLAHDLAASQGHSAPVHPWGDREEPSDHGPIIDLDPTSEHQDGPFMQPGVRPPQAPPARLPNHLPRVGVEHSNGATSPGSSSQPSGTPGVVGRSLPASPSLTTLPTNLPSGQGGPPSQSSSTIAPSGNVFSDMTGLQPIPAVKARSQGPSSAFSESGSLGPGVEENDIFRVSVPGGEWNKASREGLLKVKLVQTNISPVAQSNLGRFVLRCTDGTRIESSRTRSYLPDGTLAPLGERSGDLVFRLDAGKIPKQLELEGALRLKLLLELR